jgi:hypothetical protein
MVGMIDTAQCRPGHGPLGMAKGILMQCHDVGDAQDFRMLVEISQSVNVKLRERAAGLLHTVASCNWPWVRCRCCFEV